MIVVHSSSGPHEFPTGVRFSTEDGFNNLCVWSGRDGEALLAVFADGRWEWVEFSDG